MSSNLRRTKLYDMIYSICKSDLIFCFAIFFYHFAHKKIVELTHFPTSINKSVESAMFDIMSFIFCCDSSSLHDNVCRSVGLSIVWLAVHRSVCLSIGWSVSPCATRFNNS